MYWLYFFVFFYFLFLHFSFCCFAVLLVASSTGLGLSGNREINKYDDDDDDDVGRNKTENLARLLLSICGGVWSLGEVTKSCT